MPGKRFSLVGLQLERLNLKWWVFTRLHVQYMTDIHTLQQGCCAWLTYLNVRFVCKPNPEQKQCFIGAKFLELFKSTIV